MRGLLFGTVVALAFRSIDVIYFSYKHIIKQPMIKYLKIAVVGLILVVGYCGFFMWLYPIEVSSWGEWLINAVICAASALILFLGTFCILFLKETRLAISVLKKFLNKKSKVKG